MERGRRKVYKIQNAGKTFFKSWLSINTKGNDRLETHSQQSDSLRQQSSMNAKTR